MTLAGGRTGAPLPQPEARAIDGTRDLLPPAVGESLRLRSLLQGFLTSHGYAPVELPLLERTGLYLRKLGSRVAGSMFNLTDQRGERLSVRPELTASAIRAFLDARGSLPVPVRWQYCGPVFRDSDVPGRPRQFTQLGAELIGSGEPRADAELLAVACSGLQEAGLVFPRLVLGHAGLIPSLLEQLPLSERARMYLAGHVDLLRQGAAGIEALQQGLAERQLLGASGDLHPPTSSGQAETDEATNLVGWLLSAGATRSTGRRSTEQIVRRFQAKLHGADDPALVEKALGIAGEIARVRAAPSAALEEGRAIAARHGLSLPPLTQLQAIVSLLASYDLAGVTVEVDLGLTRALGYYTGIIFEVQGLNSAVPIGGGGRYDGLVRALGGGDDVPALGFAYTLEDLEAALPNADQQSFAATVLVVPENDGWVPQAVRHLESLRATGISGILEVIDRSPEERVRYCADTGIDRIVLVGPAGVQEQALDQPLARAGAR